ncbi:MAG: PfkB family carbohydrate kinase [Alphaproteobacteria bacterium]
MTFHSSASYRMTILDLPALASTMAQLRRTGKKIVLCHGTFDLLHIGHIRHFEAAKKHGDVLVVTITADRHVKKGIDRPVFNQALRSEMIAALQLVDYVSVIDDASAIPAIEAVQPACYVKGMDYRNAADDVTGKIEKERLAVERLGGELTFTDEIVFSSSSLLNTHFGVVSDDVRAYLDAHTTGSTLQDIRARFERARSMKTLYVGEVILDEYVYVDTLGQAAKESIIATQYRSHEVFAGGVIAAANHVSDIHDTLTVLTATGQDDPLNAVVSKRLKPGISLKSIDLPGRPTVRKQRFIDRSYMRKMHEVYYMDDTPMPADREAEFLDLLAAETAKADIVCVTDFGHGLINDKAVKILAEKARFLAVNVQTNSGNRGYNLISKYPRADFVCLDAPELRLACADKHASIENLILEKMSSLIDARSVIVTHGRDGCYLKNDDGQIERIPALTKRVVDTVGAGDAFFAYAAPLAAVDTPIRETALVGNIAGALKVDIVGHSKSVEPENVLRYLETLLK